MPAGTRRDEIGVDADVLGVEAARRIQEAGGEDALADCPARHAVTDGGDRPRPFRAEHVRERGRRALHLGIAALPLERIPRANSGGLEPDQNLSYRALPLCEPAKLQPNRHTGDANA